jgi:hypothetical protein
MSSTEAQPKKTMPKRRSQRVRLSIRVLVSGIRLSGHAFSEEVHTIVINAHGALIVAAEPLHVGQLLTVRHLISKEEQMCRVIQIETGETGNPEVAIEFLQPAPRFWRVSFPPDDWTAQSPEAKQITAPPTPLQKPGPASSTSSLKPSSGSRKVSSAPAPPSKKFPWT